MAEIEIQNVVASGRIADILDLQALSLAMDDAGVTYKPEQFPGLVYRIKEPKAVILVFQSGKVVCTGTKTPEDAALAVDIFLEAIKGIY